jgi:ATP-binding cassette subfamily F protein 3
VILISHDRHLMDACADRLWIVRDGTVRPYEGDMDRYRAECLSERSANPNTPRAKLRQGNGAKATPQEARRRAADRRAQLAPLRKVVAAAESEIERISTQIGAIDRLLADTTLYTRDPARAQALAKERGELERARATAEMSWLKACEKYEAAEQVTQLSDLAERTG